MRPVGSMLPLEPCKRNLAGLSAAVAVESTAPLCWRVRRGFSFMCVRKMENTAEDRSNRCAFAEEQRLVPFLVNI